MTAQSSGKANDTDSVKIGFALFQDYALIDVMGPLQILGSMTRPKPEIFLAAESCEKLRSGPRTLLTPDTTFDDCPQLDVLIVPGGVARAFPEEQIVGPYKDFVCQQAQGAEYLVSVCIGALILGKLGLFDGKEATTHWAALGELGTNPGLTVAGGYPRYVIQMGGGPGKPKMVLSSGGLSSGLDLAFALVALLGGADEARAVQLANQYAPDPPYRDGDPTGAAPDTFTRAADVLAHLRPDQPGTSSG